MNLLFVLISSQRPSGTRAGCLRYGIPVGLYCCLLYQEQAGWAFPIVFSDRDQPHTGSIPDGTRSSWCQYLAARKRLSPFYWWIILRSQMVVEGGRLSAVSVGDSLYWPTVHKTPFDCITKSVHPIRQYLQNRPGAYPDLLDDGLLPDIIKNISGLLSLIITSILSLMNRIPETSFNSLGSLMTSAGCEKSYCLSRLMDKDGFTVPTYRCFAWWLVFLFTLLTGHE